MTAVCACESAKLVPLVINAAMDEQLCHSLLEAYTPAYVFVPQSMKQRFNGNIVWTVYDYVMIQTANEPYEINDKLALLMTTSGSTGSPKLVRYKYGNLEANAKNAALGFKWQEDEKGLCDLPIQYTMGLNVINSHLVIGATAVLTKENLMSPEFWKLMKEERITNFCGVPFSYEVFFRLHFETMDLPQLRTLCEGGGKLTDKRFKQLAEYAQKAGKRFCPSFGTTETSARMAILPAELAMTKTGSIGRAIPEGELFLLDVDGNEIHELEAEGELGYRGPNVTMGYGICRTDLLKGDEWKGEYHTGDIARRDEDGCYYIVGRTSRFLKLYGLRVSLDRCELFIKTEFDIECACTGTDDRMEIYITDSAFKDQIIPFISKKTNLQPASFRVHVIDEFPRSDSGKVAYRMLKEL
jgi:acyl-coenzyme A synthetase/AMP-(fatty) acid ligase